MTEDISYDIQVSAITDYVEDQSFPDEQRYIFAYTISITNTGTVPATLLRRHWIITDANNKVQEVHGEGVVGEQPYLQPGETYKYTSGAMLETPVGCMEGKYDMVAEDGNKFSASIPIFSLKVPNTLH
jgi:ApaG protein